MGEELAKNPIEITKYTYNKDTRTLHATKGLERGEVVTQSQINVIRPSKAQTIVEMENVMSLQLGKRSSISMH